MKLFQCEFYFSWTDKSVIFVTYKADFARSVQRRISFTVGHNDNIAQSRVAYLCCQALNVGQV